jgi:hypothetical protein
LARKLRRERVKGEYVCDLAVHECLRARAV